MALTRHSSTRHKHIWITHTKQMITADTYSPRFVRHTKSPVTEARDALLPCLMSPAMWTPFFWFGVQNYGCFSLWRCTEHKGHYVSKYTRFELMFVGCNMHVCVCVLSDATVFYSPSRRWDISESPVSRCCTWNQNQRTVPSSLRDGTQVL